MPLTYVSGGWGFGVGESIFCIGVLGVCVFVIGVLSRDPHLQHKCAPGARSHHINYLNEADNRPIKYLRFLILL